MDTTHLPAADATTASRHHRTAAPWAWWGAVGGACGLAGNLVASHGPLSDADAGSVIADTDRVTQHAGTLLGMVAFAALVLLASGWRRWAASGGGLVEHALATAFGTTAALVLFGNGLRGALSEYLPEGINDDNFDDHGLYVLFVLHDTAPWTAWWGVILAAGLLAYLSFTARVVPLWLGVLSVAALLPPIAVMAGSGALAGAGFIGPIWLAIASVTIALRGLPPATLRA